LGPSIGILHGRVSAAAGIESSGTFQIPRSPPVVNGSQQVACDDICCGTPSSEGHSYPWAGRSLGLLAWHMESSGPLLENSPWRRKRQLRAPDRSGSFPIFVALWLAPIQLAVRPRAINSKFVFHSFQLYWARATAKPSNRGLCIMVLSGINMCFSDPTDAPNAPLHPGEGGDTQPRAPPVYEHCESVPACFNGLFQTPKTKHDPFARGVPWSQPDDILCPH
jgi:hypothetical protein